METPKIQHPAACKTYYLQFRAFYLIPAVLLWPLALLAQEIIFSLLWLLLGIGAIAATRTRIVVSPAGISYYNNIQWYSLHSTWHNIEKIDLIECHNSDKQLCAVLRKGKNLGWWATLDETSSVSSQELGRLIPIRPGFNIFDVGAWSNPDDLENEIRRYIPNVEGLG